MSFDFTPRELNGRRVTLLPPSMEHHAGLCEAVLNEPDGWFAKNWAVTTPEKVQKIIEGAIRSNLEKKTISFMIYDKISNRIAGINHFMKMDSANRKLEIGGTQVGREFRRTHVNTETKLLMLTEAFEGLNCNRVEFRVDSENLNSQAAVKRIGAKYEGELRHEVVLPDGRVHNYQVFSMIKPEWPSVKQGLETLCARNYRPLNTVHPHIL